MVCPVFLDTGWDSGSPRGRMILAYGLLSGELTPDEEMVDRLYQCTQCTDCARRCPSQVNCPEVVVAARREMVNQFRNSSAQTALVANVETTGNIFADLSMEFPVQEGSFPLFIGCQHLSRPNNTRKMIKLLQKLGIEPGITQEVCCGFPLKNMGFEEAHTRQVERVRQTFPLTGEPVLTLCPSCMIHLQKEYHQPAVHVLQEIDRRLDQLTVIAPVNKKVTYHDPCDLSRGAKIIEEPRRILKKIGCDLVEMAHTKALSRCCGGGGGILTWDPALSNRLAVARIGEATATGAEMIVTACATCEQTLKKASSVFADQTGTKPVPVRHLMDLLVKVM